MNDIMEINLNLKSLKLYTAMQNLKNSVELYFNGETESALVLAGAAEEIMGFFAAEFDQNNLNSFRQWNKALINMLKIVDIQTPNNHLYKTTKEKNRRGNILKAAYNERKHLDNQNELYLARCADKEIKDILDSAVQDFILIDDNIMKHFSDLGLEYYCKQRKLLVTQINRYTCNAN